MKTQGPLICYKNSPFTMCLDTQSQIHIEMDEIKTFYFLLFDLIFFHLYIQLGDIKYYCFISSLV